jgi:hypothetical protein
LDGKNNNRVTLAVLSTKLDLLAERLASIEQKLDGYCSAAHDLEREHLALSARVDRLSERVTLWAGLQSFLALVLSSAAAFLGTRR